MQIPQNTLLLKTLCVSLISFWLFAKAKLASTVKYWKGIRAYKLIQTAPWLVLAILVKDIDQH